MNYFHPSLRNKAAIRKNFYKLPNIPTESNIREEGIAYTEL